MKSISDFASPEEVLSECLTNPDTLLVLLVAGYGTGGASNTLLLKDLSGCPMFTQDEVTWHANQLIKAGLMHITSIRNASLTQAGLTLLLRTASQTH